VVVWVSDFITKDVYLLTVPYRSSFHLKEKTKNSYKKETPAETARRELFEETGLIIENKDLFLFHEVQKFDNRRRSRRAFHFQYFFSIRKVMEVTDFNSKDFLIGRSGETADPVFIPKKMVSKYLFYKHRIAIGLK
jgi:8-oxo-dGTP pyrophosphatase MutT (NUDIX family)